MKFYYRISNQHIWLITTEEEINPDFSFYLNTSNEKQTKLDDSWWSGLNKKYVAIFFKSANTTDDLPEIILDKFLDPVKVAKLRLRNEND